MEQKPTTTTDSDTLTTTQSTDGQPQGAASDDGPTMPELPVVP
jgi:hypothetical protein